jgi:4-carboxymuconolactone decarboxylase
MVAGKLQTDWIPEHVTQCVDAGLGRTEIGETLMHVYCYAGVYPSIASFKIAGATLQALEDAGKLSAEQASLRNQLPPTNTAEERIAHGLQIRRDLFGNENIEAALAQSDDFQNLFNDLTHDFCFGNIWARDTFTHPMRSQLCLAIASATGQIGAVERHVRSAVRANVSKKRIAEIFLLAYVYGGAHHAHASFEAARKAIDAIEEESK